MKVHKAHRHTIMDGRVVTYAPSFIETEALFGKRYEPFGEFIISVSRNKLVVDQCHIIAGDEFAFRGFIATLKEAQKQLNYLRKCSGRPKDNWDGSPIKIHLDD